MGDAPTVEQMRDFLGVQEEQDTEIAEVLASAVETVCRETGIDWTKRAQNRQFAEAVRVQVWVSYYAVRDASKNTVFLLDYLQGLLCSLQLCAGEEMENAT